MNDQAKPQIMYAIKGKGGLFNVSHYRKESIRMQVEGSTLTWKQWQQQFGLKVVNVEVREIQK